MKLKKAAWLILLGTLWTLIGFMLLRKGLFFLFMKEDPSFNQSLILMLIAMGVGFLKGKFILKKTAFRLIDKMTLIQGDVSYRQVFDKRMLFIMALMMGLGMGMNYASIAPLVRGFIDCVVGSALLQGSTFFFRAIYTKRESTLL